MKVFHALINIIYEFKDNNTVVISYDSKEVEYWPLPGEYSYNFDIPEYGYGIVIATPPFLSLPLLR